MVSGATSVGAGFTTIFVYDNNDRYEGDVNNGVPPVRGTFIFASGDRYTGLFKEGVPNGIGTFIYANGDYYSGGIISCRLG